MFSRFFFISSDFIKAIFVICFAEIEPTSCRNFHSINNYIFMTDIKIFSWIIPLYSSFLCISIISKIIWNIKIVSVCHQISCKKFDFIKISFFRSVFVKTASISINEKARMHTQHTKFPWWMRGVFHHSMLLFLCSPMSSDGGDWCVCFDWNRNTAQANYQRIFEPFSADWAYSLGNFPSTKQKLRKKNAWSFLPPFPLHKNSPKMNVFCTLLRIFHTRNTFHNHTAVEDRFFKVIIVQSQPSPFDFYKFRWISN